MKFSRFLIFAIIAFSAFALSGCTSTEALPQTGCHRNIGIVFDIGGKNDRSFNAAAWEGVKRAQGTWDMSL